MPLFIGPRWSTYSTKYFHCFTIAEELLRRPDLHDVPGQRPLVHPHLPRRDRQGRELRLANGRSGGRAPTRPPGSRSALDMRWFLRRLLFYVFALWVAVTLNFLLPRLMPGDPMGGVLARLSTRRRSSRTRGSSRPTRRSSAGGSSRSGRRIRSTCSTSPRSTSGSRPRTIRRRSPRWSGGRFRTRSSSSGSRSCSRSCSGRASAWSPRGAAAALVDNFVVPALMSFGAFPAFFTSLLAVYFLGLKLGWFPIQHAYDNGVDARLQLGVPLERASATRSCR